MGYSRGRLEQFILRVEIWNKSRQFTNIKNSVWKERVQRNRGAQFWGTLTFSEISTRRA